MLRRLLTLTSLLGIIPNCQNRYFPINLMLISTVLSNNQKVFTMYRIIGLDEVNRWFSANVYFTPEIKGTQVRSGTSAIKAFKSLVRKHTIKAVGPSNRPGYICIIRKDNLVRIGFSRRPENKIKKVKKNEEAQELVWYRFTEDMLIAKQEALSYFSDYRVEGDWLRISPLMAMTYFKREG